MLKSPGRVVYIWFIIFDGFDFDFIIFFLPQVTGYLDDCTCDVETIDAFNNYKLFPRLNELLESDYFRYYKVIFSYKNCSYLCAALFFFISLELIADLL